MFTIRTRYACVLSLLLGALTANAQDVEVQDNEQGNAVDTVAVEVPSRQITAGGDVTSSQTMTANTIDPFRYSVQNRFLNGGGVDSDTLKLFQNFKLSVFSGVTLHGSPRSVGATNLSRMDVGRPLGGSLTFQLNPFRKYRDKYKENLRPPLHSLRLIYVNNRYTHNTRTHGDLTTHELGLGYMFNLTNYFKGYNPAKRMNVFATATAYGTLQKDDEKREMGARGEIGLMFDYRFWRNLSVFAEPYFGLATDDYDRVYTPHKYDWLGGLRAGVSANMGVVQDFAEHIKRNRTDYWEPQAWWQHFYFGSSYGKIWTNADPLPYVDKKWIDSHVFLGYRFTPVQSLRFMATYYKNPEPIERKHHVMGEVDYMINFTNMWRGYHPERRFRVSGYVGAGARYLAQNGGKLHGGEDKIAPTVTAGFDFNYYLTKQISLFVEPHMAVAFPMGSGGKTTVFGGARGGFQVDLIDTHIYMPHYAVSDEDMDVADAWKLRPLSHFFFGSSVGFMGVHRFPGYNKSTLPFNVFLGYRFTPVQSLRLQTTYIKTNEQILHRKRLNAALDYMVNFTNLFYGYKPSRRLNVTGFVGTGFRTVEEYGTEGKYALLFRAGADVRYQFYKGLSVFVEPYANLVHQKQQRYYVFDYGINGGLAVTLDDINMYSTRLHGDLSPDWERKFWRHMFVGGSGGIMRAHTQAYNKTTTPMNMFVGYRFSPNHAIRLQGSYIRTQENMDRKRHLEGEVDYMLNLTNMFVTYKPNRLLNVFTYWGLGAKYVDNLNDRDGKFSPMATMGLDVALRIKRGLSVFAEPYLAVAKGRNQGFYAIYYGANAGLALNLEDVYAFSPRWGEPSAAWVEKPVQRLFFGGGVGWLRTQFSRDHNAIPLTAFVGYRFNPIHALRAKVSLNRTKISSNTRQYMSAGVDYMFNATNMLCDYDPNRPINFIGFIGLGARDLNATNKLTQDAKFRLMGNAGMDIALRMTRNVNLYVEPYVGAAHSTSNTALVNFFMGINGGVVLNLESIDQPYKNDRRATNHNPFFEASYGWMFPMGTAAGTNGSGLSLDARAGVWIDPLFAVRGSFLAQNYGYSKHYHTQSAKDNDAATGYANAMVLKARVEGVFNPLNISSEWRQNEDEKKFGLNIAAGLEIGGQGKKYAIGMNQDRYGIVGLTAAIQALYKVNYNTAIFVEPRFEHVSPFYTHGNSNRYGDHEKDNIVTVNAGLRVIRGVRDQRDDERRLNFEQTMFFGASFGGYKAIAAYKVNDGGRLGKFFGANIGFLITPLHGVKLHLQPSWYKARLDENGEQQKFTLMDYRVLYMLNFSNFYQSSARRKIDAYLEAGPQLTSIIKRPATVSKKRAPGVATGFLIAYNINRNWAITTEPIGQIVFKKRFLPGYGVKPRMARLRADISIGTMWKF